MKICVMHSASIGDTLLATPVYRAIKQRYPQSKLIAVVSYTGRELLQGNPYIDELVAYRKGDSVLRIIKLIWRADAAVILDYHYRSALYAFLAMISKRIGRGKDFINIQVSDEAPLEYEPFKYLRLLKKLDIDNDNIQLTGIVANDSDKKHVKNLLSSYGLEGKRYVVIVPYSLSSLKDWEPEKYREIIKRLTAAGYKVVALGGKDEQERIKKEFPNIISFAGVTNLRESAEIITQAKAQLCGCTAMLHVCSTTQTPVVAIYGPSKPEQWAPKHNCVIVTHEFECSPCCNTDIICQKNNGCISEITVDEVYTELQKFL